MTNTSIIHTGRPTNRSTVGYHSAKNLKETYQLKTLKDSTFGFSDSGAEIIKCSEDRTCTAKLVLWNEERGTVCSLYLEERQRSHLLFFGDLVLIMFDRELADRFLCFKDCILYASLTEAFAEEGRTRGFLVFAPVLKTPNRLFWRKIIADMHGIYLIGGFRFNDGGKMIYSNECNYYSIEDLKAIGAETVNGHIESMELTLDIEDDPLVTQTSTKIIAVNKKYLQEDYKDDETAQGIEESKEEQNPNSAGISIYDKISGTWMKPLDNDLFENVHLKNLLLENSATKNFGETKYDESEYLDYVETQISRMPNVSSDSVDVKVRGYSPIKNANREIPKTNGKMNGIKKGEKPFIGKVEVRDRKTNEILNSGSGVVFGPNLVLTAAHNLFPKNLKQSLNDQFNSDSLSKNKLVFTFGAQTQTETVEVVNYEESVENYNLIDADCALLILSENIGNTIGYFGLYMSQSKDNRIKDSSFSTKPSPNSSKISRLEPSKEVESLDQKELVSFLSKTEDTIHNSTLSSQQDVQGIEFKNEYVSVNYETYMNIRSWILKWTWSNADTIDLSWSSIGNTGAAILAQKLSSGRLREVNLTENNIDLEGLVNLTKTKNWNQLVILNLSMNQIGDKGTAYLATNNAWPKLELLNLSFNHINDEGASSLAGNNTWTSLFDLNLSGNNITLDTGKTLLANKAWMSLHRVNLSNNKIPTQSISQLLLRTSWKSVKSLQLKRDCSCEYFDRVLDSVHHEPILTLIFEELFYCVATMVKQGAPVPKTTFDSLFLDLIDEPLFVSEYGVNMEDILIKIQQALAGAAFKESSVMEKIQAKFRIPDFGFSEKYLDKKKTQQSELNIFEIIESKDLCESKFSTERLAYEVKKLIERRAVSLQLLARIDRTFAINSILSNYHSPLFSKRILQWFSKELWDLLRGDIKFILKYIKAESTEILNAHAYCLSKLLSLAKEPRNTSMITESDSKFESQLISIQTLETKTCSFWEEDTIQTFSQLDNEISKQGVFDGNLLSDEGRKNIENGFFILIHELAARESLDVSLIDSNHSNGVSKVPARKWLMLSKSWPELWNRVMFSRPIKGLHEIKRIENQEAKTHSFNPQTIMMMSGASQDNYSNQGQKKLCKDPSIYPHSAIGIVEINSTKGSNSKRIGTGTLIGSNLILTSAHLLFEDGDDEKLQIYFTPAAGNDQIQPGKFKATKWLPNECPESILKDYALLMLDEHIGLQIGYLGIHATSEGAFESIAKEKSFEIWGYSCDKNDGGNGDGQEARSEQWGIEADLKLNNEDRRFITLGSKTNLEGQKGSTCFYRGSENAAFVTGIHSSRSDGDITNSNLAIRLSLEVYEELRESMKHSDSTNPRKSRRKEKPKENPKVDQASSNLNVIKAEIRYHGLKNLKDAHQSTSNELKDALFFLSPNGSTLYASVETKIISAQFVIYDAESEILAPFFLERNQRSSIYLWNSIAFLYFDTKMSTKVAPQIKGHKFANRLLYSDLRQAFLSTGKSKGILAFAPVLRDKANLTNRAVVVDESGVYLLGGTKLSKSRHIPISVKRDCSYYRLTALESIGSEVEESSPIESMELQREDLIVAQTKNKIFVTTLAGKNKRFKEDVRGSAFLEIEILIKGKLCWEKFKASQIPYTLYYTLNIVPGRDSKDNLMILGHSFKMSTTSGYIIEDELIEDSDQLEQAPVIKAFKETQELKTVAEHIGVAASEILYFPNSYSQSPQNLFSFSD